MLLRSAIHRRGAALAAPALLLLLAACSSPGGMPGGTLPPPNVIIVAQKEPPPPQAETVPPPPAATASEYFVWEPGHWHWTGTGFVWIPGLYIERPYLGRVWIHGGWSYSDLTWTAIGADAEAEPAPQDPPFSAVMAVATSRLRAARSWLIAAAWAS